MATLLIRNLDDEVRNKLRVRAAEHGRSMEEEARTILSDTVERDEADPDSLPGSGAALLARLRDGLVGGEDIDFGEFPDQFYEPESVWGDEDE
ncbi:MAG: FitA-like ribbon-helix-helix domain-containing protein [Vitreimonas sp.]